MQKVLRSELIVFTAIMTIMVVYAHCVSETVTKYARDYAFYIFTFTTQKFCYFVVAGFIFISAIKYFQKFSRELNPRELNLREPNLREPNPRESNPKESNLRKSNLRESNLKESNPKEISPSNQFSYLRFIRGRVTKIFLPYVLWVIIYYLYFVYNRHFFDFKITDLIRYIFVGDIAAQVYFVIAIMQFYLLMPLWRWISKICGRKKLYWGIFIFCSAVIMYISKIYFAWFDYNDRIFPSLMLFWAAGMLCGVYYDEFVNLVKKQRVMILIVFAVVSIYHIGRSYLNVRQLLSYAHEEQYKMLFYAVCVIFFYSVSLWISENLPKSLPVSKTIDAASYYIYLSHILAINVIDECTLGMGITTRMMIKTVFTLVVTFTLSILYVKLKALIKSKAFKNFGQTAAMTQSKNP